MTMSGIRENLDANFARDLVKDGVAISKAQAYLQQDKKFKEEIKGLEEKIEKLTEERDLTVAKFEEGQEVWEGKLQKSQKENKTLLEMNQGLKDDNKDLMLQIDKQIKRVISLENEVEREGKEKRELELKLHDQKRENQNLQD